MTIVKYVDYGIGSHCGTHIEINRELIPHPELHKMVYQHEKKHTKGFKLSEFFGEFGLVLNPSLYVWMLRNPKSFLGFFPYKNGYIDIHLVIFYIILGGLIWIAFK